MSRSPNRPLSSAEYKRWQRREVAIEQIAEAFHSEGFPNWEHIADLVFQEIKRHRGQEFVHEHFPQLKERYGAKAVQRMLPEIIEIVGDDDARRIFGRYKPLKPRDRQRDVVDAALVHRYLNMPKRNKAELVRQKLEENQNLPTGMKRGIGGINPATLEEHIRGLLDGLPSDSDLRLVKP